MVDLSGDWFSTSSLDPLAFDGRTGDPSTFHDPFLWRAQPTPVLGSGHLPGPKRELLSNTRKWIVWRGKCVDNATDTSLGRGTQAESSRVRDPRRTTLPCGFMVMGLVSGLSLANHSDSGSFLVAHALLSQDGCQWKGFWEVVGHTVSPFDLSLTFPIGGDLLVSCSLPGPPNKHNSHKWLPWYLPGQCGQFQSVCFP